MRFASRLVDGWLLERTEHSDHLDWLHRVVSAEPVLSPQIAALARVVADRCAGTLSDVLRLAVPPRYARVEADGGVLAHGRDKRARKGCDLLVVNAVGQGRAFDVEHNAGWLLGDDGVEIELPEDPKTLLASYVWDAVTGRLTGS